MISRLVLSSAALLVSSLHAAAADPGWWTARGVKNASPASNLSPATIGQAKHMAAMALEELRPKLPAADFASLRTDVAAVVDLAVPTSPSAGFYEEQKAMLLVGQLKALADPFYRHLKKANFIWLETQLWENQTNDTSNPDNYFPWTTTTADDANKAPATLGQLKAVFALRFTDDADGNQLPDFWEYLYFGGTGNSGSADPDGDGLTNEAESNLGTNPFLADSDGDGVPDNTDAYPMDPSRWTTSGSNDVTAPQIILISPENALPL